MSNRAKGLWSGLLGLILFGGLAVGLIFLVNRTAPIQTAQEPEPGPILEDTPTPVLQANPFDSPVETPTTELTLEPTATPTREPTATPLPGDEPVPIEQILDDNILLFTAWRTSGENVRSSLRFLPLTNTQDLMRSQAVDLGLDVEVFVNSVSPDGRYVLLIETTDMTGGRPYIFDRQTNETKSFFSDTPWIAGLGQDWSNDNKKLLFSSTNVGGLWLLDIETGTETLIRSKNGPVQGASISPSGEQVSFIDAGKNAYNALWTVDTTGQNKDEPHFVFDINGPSGNEGWSSKGILYLESGVSQEKGEPSETGILWAYDPASGQRLNFDVPLDTTFGFGSSLSPDKTKLAFTGLPNEAPDCSQADPFSCLLPYFDIYVLHINDGRLANLGEGIYPEWSPDSQNLVFVSYRTGKSEVWTVSIDGSNLKQLSDEEDGLEKSQVFWVAK